MTSETREPYTLAVSVDVRPYGPDHGQSEQVRARMYEILCQAHHPADPAGEDDGAGPPTPGSDGARQRAYGDVDGVPFHRAEHLPVADFEEFHAEHRKRLIALVRTVLVQQGWHDGVDVEDIVQDTLELAVLNWPRIGRMKEPGGYLRTVAVNKAYRAMGKSLREVAVSSSSLLAFFESAPAGGFERSPEEIVTADFARDLLRSLPQRQAQVLVLTADGWTDSQIGKKLDLHPATVRSHRRYARKVLLGQRERIMGLVP
ncbi:RNA polymerase sigma factor [Kitasatospora purpeofusca]|uniref:RNA polymerase sigma factor n=1 Tax=Kitasatospora purpeofusca TaxID=67352 RepID=UPI0036741869